MHLMHVIFPAENCISGGDVFHLESAIDLYVIKRRLVLECLVSSSDSVDITKPSWVDET